jgi:hypothetical protein
VRAPSSAATNTDSPGVSSWYAFHFASCAVPFRSGSEPASTTQRASCAGSLSHCTNSTAAFARRLPLSNSVHVSGAEIVTASLPKAGSGATPKPVLASMKSGSCHGPVTTIPILSLLNSW